MIYDTLIDSDAVFAHLGNPDWVVVDCRFNLMDTESGHRAYLEGHIPGAHYAHLDKDLSGVVTASSGRHPLPHPARLASTLGKWGISPSSQVVAYDDSGGMIAARLWWLLHWLGSRRCAVLNGGLPDWIRQGFPLDDGSPPLRGAAFPENHDDRLWVDTATVLAEVINGDSLLIDARAAARYLGQAEPIDPVAGHVPNAVNLPTEGNLASGGRFLPPATLRERFDRVIGGRRPEEVFHMCGSGVTACHNLLAMETAGITDTRLYAGSWSEWIRDSHRPIALGGD